MATQPVNFSKNLFPYAVRKNHYEAIVTYGYIGVAHWAQQIYGLSAGQLTPVHSEGNVR